MTPDEIEHMRTYLSLVALTAEHRQNDVLEVLQTLDPDELIRVWLAGLSVSVTYARRIATTEGIDDLPAWIRASEIGDPPTETTPEEGDHSNE